VVTADVTVADGGTVEHGVGGTMVVVAALVAVGM
ncbi:uncharacterized protein METZ01_LOCUS515599, partial [marine metagenome]